MENAIPSSDQPSGRRIGNYVVKRPIGEGGMGKVYEAEELLSGRRVALKILHQDLANSSRGRAQFLGEMKILSNLDCPHIVRCLHCAEFDGELVMVLEYLEGATLRFSLNQKVKFSQTETVKMGLHVCAALVSAHGASRAIIHRDLKPENIMVLDNGRVKVMDFGIAKVVQTAMATTTHSVGTLQYMSPEQVDARAVDARSDLFALGVVLWEMLAGYPPFRAESPRLLLEQICVSPTPALPVDVVPELEQLIMNLLEKDPAKRPRAALDVQTRLRSVAKALKSEQRSKQAAKEPESRNPMVGLDTVAIVHRASGPREIETRTIGLASALITVLTIFLTWVAYVLSHG